MSSTNSNYAVEILSLTKDYRDRPVLNSIDLKIKHGEFVALLGPSGCGKSTLLKLIAGLEDPGGGEIHIGGKLANYLRPSERDVAMVFQNYALYPHMTVRENLGFPLKMAKLPKAEVDAKVTAAAAIVQLDKELGRYPDELSGGQRQRVALGRAIVREPLVFLMDEPLSNLDALLRIEMRTELVRLHKRVGRTTIYVTHDQIEAMTMADRVVLLNNGAIQQVGTPEEIYNTPANTFTARFVGSPAMNLIPGIVTQSGKAVGFQTEKELKIPNAPAKGSPGTKITIGIRPENIRLEKPGPGTLDATVELVERVGADLHVFVTLSDGTPMIVRAEAQKRLTAGDRVSLRLDPRAFSLFDSNSNRVK